MRLVEEPEKFLNPVLLTVNILQTASAFLSTILARPAVRHVGLRPRLRAQRRDPLRVHRGDPQDVGRAAQRAGGEGDGPADAVAGQVLAAAPLTQAPDRLRQLDPARQGDQGGAVRLRAGAARHRRGGRQRRGDRARGARAHREHHRVRRHRCPRGDGAPPGHDHRPPRRHRHRRPRPGDRPRQQPPAAARRGRRRHRRADLHQGPDPGRAVGRRDHARPPSCAGRSASSPRTNRSPG